MPASRLTPAALITVSLAFGSFSQAQPGEQVQPAQQIKQADQPKLERIDLMTYTPPKVYEGQMVIRIRTNSQAQLDGLLSLTESVWSERTGIGQLEVQIKQSNLNAITKMGIPHDVLIADLQAHTDEQWSMLVAQERIDIQRRALEAQQQQHNNQRGGPVTVHDESWFENYKQLADINDYFTNIADTRPDLASLQVVGQSLFNNDIHAITITGPDQAGNLGDDRPVILWHGATHAREWVSPMTVTYLASSFTDAYDTDPRVKDLLDRSRIVIVPVTNPDGYLHTWSDARFWRKNRRSNGGGTVGVDINRNWGFEWGGQGASRSSRDETYRGTGPFSEPETRVIRDLALCFGDDLLAHIDYHTYSQLILWPFGYADDVITPEPDRTFFDNLAKDLSNEILDISGERYAPKQSVRLYPAAGTSSDWFYGEHGVTSLTFELRPSNPAQGGFSPTPDIILPTAQENFEAAKLFVERVLEPISLWFEPIDTIHAMLPNKVTVSVTDGLTIHNPESVTINWRIGSTGDFTTQSIPNAQLSDYTFELPLVPCGETIEYYFQAATLGGLPQTYPPQGALAPFSSYAEGFIASAHEDTIELDTGWIVGSSNDTATSGIWTRMDPEGTSAQPENDHSPEGTICWVTDGVAGVNADDGDVDNGYTSLTSPRFDAVILGDEAILSYWVWHSGNEADADTMTTRISNDNGNSWTSIEFYRGTTNQWEERQFRIADYILPTDQMRVRFMAVDLNSDNTIEAAIDDLRVGVVGCVSTNPADLNDDGVLDFFDVSAFLDAFGEQSPVGDFNDDGSWDFFDVSAFLDAFAEN